MGTSIVHTKNLFESEALPMCKFTVKINTIDRVKTFVSICNTFDCDIDLGSGRYVIDAKSIMGIFSFDLTKPLTVCIHSDNADDIKRFNEEMKDFKI